MKCIPTYEISGALSVHRSKSSTSTTGWHSTFTTKKSKVEAVTMKTELNGAAHEYVCLGGAEAGIPTGRMARDFYERKFPRRREGSREYGTEWDSDDNKGGRSGWDI